MQRYFVHSEVISGLVLVREAWADAQSRQRNPIKFTRTPRISRLEGAQLTPPRLEDADVFHRQVEYFKSSYDPRGLGVGCRGGTSRIVPLAGPIPPMSPYQAVAALHLMRMSEPSLKFQRL